MPCSISSMEPIDLVAAAGTPDEMLHPPAHSRSTSSALLVLPIPSDAPNGSRPRLPFAAVQLVLRTPIAEQFAKPMPSNGHPTLELA
jgi:hypothetical protein